MTKLVPPARRCHIVGDARESRFVGAGIRISEHGYIDAADRCCLRRLTWSGDREYSATHHMPIVLNVKIAISLIFTAATRLSFHQQSPVAVCVRLPSCPGHARVRVGAPAVSSYASEAKRKRNEIPLSINNNPLIQCLLTVMEKNWK